MAGSGRAKVRLAVDPHRVVCALAQKLAAMRARMELQAAPLRLSSRPSDAAQAAMSIVIGSAWPPPIGGSRPELGRTRSSPWQRRSTSRAPPPPSDRTSRPPATPPTEPSSSHSHRAETPQSASSTRSCFQEVWCLFEAPARSRIHGSPEVSEDRSRTPWPSLDSPPEKQTHHVHPGVLERFPTPPGVTSDMM